MASAYRGGSVNMEILGQTGVDINTLWRHARDPHEHEVYNAVCRRLYQFMTGTKG